MRSLIILPEAEAEMLEAAAFYERQQFGAPEEIFDSSPGCFHQSADQSDPLSSAGYCRTTLFAKDISLRRRVQGSGWNHSYSLRYASAS
jgi:hydroxyacyl-ACP dehydratase HTD2-like protein with hotdog domain